MFASPPPRLASRKMCRIADSPAVKGLSARTEGPSEEELGETTVSGTWDVRIQVSKERTFARAVRFAPVTLSAG